MHRYLTTRRTTLVQALYGAGVLALSMGRARAHDVRDNQPSSARWYEAAARMRQLALGWGDQAYGAVLVLNDTLVGEGPSKVVKNADPNAHAERVAIADAQARLGRASLAGSVLYSTSRPCRECEDAAARAQVSRMIYGEALHDAGRPTLR